MFFNLGVKNEKNLCFRNMEPDFKTYEVLMRFKNQNAALAD